MKINIDDLKYEFKFREREDSDAFPATMILRIGQFEVKGFSVRKTGFEENEKGFFLSPPSNRIGGGKWIKLFFTEIKEDWGKLEANALKQFNKEHQEYLIKVFGQIPVKKKTNKEEIDVDKIPL